MSKTAFAVGAHPDDIEFLMAGTLLLLKEAGYEIHTMNIANGSCGTIRYDLETITKIRREESLEAARVAGAVYHDSLVNDIEIFYEKSTLARLASIIREISPEILLVHSPEDYMEDHTNACRLAVSAAFSRGMPNFPADPPREPTNQDVTIYHCQPHLNRDPLGKLVYPEIFVDISGVINKKAVMLACHKSQKEWLDRSQGMDSYLVSQRNLAREVGAMSGRFEFAEGWRKHLHAGFCPESADPLREALGPLTFVNESY
ncbi:MAG TPA: PIG-L family deacetylase [archaeon]|nr:PIG-L family deacetylase [archaeon]